MISRETEFHLSLFNLIPTLDKVLRDIQDYRAFKCHVNLHEISRRIGKRWRSYIYIMPWHPGDILNR